eukprot:2265340-Alexandrium_andersonii.AAC.1
MSSTRARQHRLAQHAGHHTYTFVHERVRIQIGGCVLQDSRYQASATMHCKPVGGCAVSKYHATS